VIGEVRQTKVAINVSLSTAMGCPMEGDIDQAEVLDWMQRFADLGVHGVTLCDTTGMAYPSQVGALCVAARERFAALELTLHFHNTRGMALANTLAALDAGIDRLAVWAGVPTRRAQRATSAPKNWCTCSSSTATTPAWISRPCCPPRPCFLD
jgi:pyruvate/oxaloacetate carboxyltransferase